MGQHMTKNIAKNSLLKDYYPLIVIISLITFSSIALQIASSSFDAIQIMHYFMGLFFVIFSMFKLINIDGFAKGFRMYDMLAKHYPSYGYLYPFIELILGLAYLSNAFPILTNLVTFTIMTISSVGVINSVKGGMNLKCACLGTVLNVPLSTVSILENVGMGLMALGMLLENF
jgi:hypothetical protein